MKELKLLNYYDILDIAKDADERAIKEAYRKLAKLYHPDLHPDDANCAEKFREVTEAYDTLIDPDKREQYDNTIAAVEYAMNPKKAEEEAAKAAKEKQGAASAEDASKSARDKAREAAKRAAQKPKNFKEKVSDVKAAAKRSQKRARIIAIVGISLVAVIILGVVGVMLANYIENNKSYTITFDYGDGTTINTSVKKDEYITPMPDPKKDDYQFLGWFTSDNQKWGFTNQKPTGDMVLKAHWALIEKYILTFDYQGADGNNSIQNIEIVYGNTIQLVKPSKRFHLFDGWFTEPKGAGQRYTDASGMMTLSWGFNQDTTFYANWVVASYTVILDYNGSDHIEMDTVTVQYGETFTRVAARTGYKFLGWYDKPQGTSGATRVTHSDGLFESWDIDENNITLYAWWLNEANLNHVITFNPDGGTVGAETMNVVFGETKAEEQLPIPTKAGFTFGGWFSESSGKGQKFTDEDGKLIRDWDEMGNTTLYALWIAE